MLLKLQGRWMIGAVCIAMMGCAPAWSSSSSSGTLYVYAPSATTLAFGFNGVRSTPPACATDPLWTITFGATTDTLVASILSFYLAGKPFTVIGSGTCDATNREVVAYITAN